MEFEFARVKVISLTIDNFQTIKKVDLFLVYNIEKQYFML
jgi:hypothetical protein